MESLIRGLYLVTNADASRQHGRTIADDVAKAVQAGISVVQYREKNASREKKICEAGELRRLIPSTVLYIVNDDLALCRSVEADGLHVGQYDIPRGLPALRQELGSLVLGVSVHTVEEALAAIRAGADYISIGSIYQTRTKQDARLLGLHTLRTIVREVHSRHPDYPIVAIGGITIDNIQEIRQTGVSSVAMISGILDYHDITERIHLLSQLWHQ